MLKNSLSLSASNLVDPLYINTISQYPGLKSLPLYPLVRGLSHSLMIKQLLFTVAEQRQNYIGLPYKEDIGKYPHLIAHINFIDKKQQF